MKFTFRFASILKLRRHQEKIEKQQLAALLNQKTDLEDQYASLNNKSRQESEDSLQKQSIQFNRQYYSRKHALHEKLVSLKKKIDQINAAIQKQRRQLAKANTETRMMEKLKQNERQAFIEHAEHLEQLQQNEIAIQRYNTNY